MLWRLWPKYAQHKFTYTSVVNTFKDVYPLPNRCHAPPPLRKVRSWIRSSVDVFGFILCLEKEYVQGRVWFLSGVGFLMLATDGKIRHVCYTQSRVYGCICRFYLTSNANEWHKNTNSRPSLRCLFTTHALNTDMT